MTGTRMANNMMVSSIESMRTTMDYARYNVRDMTRLASNNARAAEEIARDITRAASTSLFTSRTGSADEREEGRERR